MVPQTKVFIGCLPQGSKPEEIRKLFERFGEVTECDVMNRCAFVHMQTEEQAAEAIKSLQNTTFNGVVITVEQGRIKERGAAAGGGIRGGARGGGVGGDRGGGGGVGRGRGGGDRGGGGGGRGGGGRSDRGGRGGINRRGGGGPMRGGRGFGRGAPYMRGPMRGGQRNGARMGRYDRNDGRYNGYGVPDERGFSLTPDSFPQSYTLSLVAEMCQNEMYDRRPISKAPMPPVRNVHMLNRTAPAMSRGVQRHPFVTPYTPPTPRSSGVERHAFVPPYTPPTPRSDGDPFLQPYPPKPRSRVERHPFVPPYTPPTLPPYTPPTPRGGGGAPRGGKDGGSGGGLRRC